MRYLLLLLLLLGLSTSRLLGQTIEPGYLVLSSGDTLRGEVENSFWEEPPTNVRFRATSTAPLATYSDIQLRGIGLNSGRLLRLELLPIDRSAETAVSRLPNNPTGHQKPEQVLADVLVLGPATLLAVTLNNVHHYFVRREEQPYMEMTERLYLGSRKGSMTITDANNYKAQLALYFGDCAAATQQAGKAAFTADDLKKVVQAYNQYCSATRQTGQELQGSKNSGSKVAIRTGGVLGVRYNSVAFTGVSSSGPDFTGANADGNVHPLGGGYLDIVNTGRRLALHSALLVSQYGSRQAANVGSGTQAGRYRWRGTLASAQLGVRGFLPIGTKTQLLLGIGYEATTAWNTTSELVVAGRKTFFLPDLRGTIGYVEAGFAHSRLGFTLHTSTFNSPRYAGYSVSAWSLSAVLSYRLSADTDKRAVAETH